MRHYIASRNRIKANRNWHERHDDERDPLYFLPKSDKEEKKERK